MAPFKPRPRRNGHHSAPQKSKSGFAARPRPEQDNPADWQRQYDRYCALARDAVGADEISREHYWQHAEHYKRLMNGSSN